MLLQAFRSAGLPAALSLAPAAVVPVLTQGLATKAAGTQAGTKKAGTSKASKGRKKSLPDVLSDKISAASKSNKSTSKKKKKEDKPKRALTAYTFFMKDSIASDDTPIRDRFKVLASKWRSLSDAEKEPYIQKAEQSKLDSAAARKEWKEGQPPLNAFAKFVQEEMPQLKASNPDQPMIQLMKAVSEKWRSMAPAEKMRRQEQYKAAKALYDANKAIDEAVKAAN